MRYGLGESLADFGFSFLEKIHEPIFLVDRLGKLVKMNEAGRKFLSVTRRTPSELETFVKSSVVNLFQDIGDSYRRVWLGKGLHLIARSFTGTDLLLIEVLK